MSTFLGIKVIIENYQLLWYHAVRTGRVDSLFTFRECVALPRQCHALGAKLILVNIRVIICYFIISYHNIVITCAQARIGSSIEIEKLMVSNPNQVRIRIHKVGLLFLRFVSFHMGSFLTLLP